MQNTNIIQNRILLTIDVEDWFQVENFKKHIPFSSWTKLELRVEKNTHYLLDLLDSITRDRIRFHNEPKATFFVLGWIAERLPKLVREIQSRGHEVASHGNNHKMCNTETYNDLKNDLINSKKLLEDITGHPVIGYRAPSFSVNDSILKVIQEAGYLYDSSYNSFSMHNRYGKLELRGKRDGNVAIEIFDRFYEIPISNFNIGKLIFPWGGGGYFRFIPLFVFLRGVRSILKRYNAYVFYIHPWEIDAQQPRMKNVGYLFKLRHYVNIDKNLYKLRRFIELFNQSNFITCNQFLFGKVNLES